MSLRLYVLACVYKCVHALVRLLPCTQRCSPGVVALNLSQPDQRSSNAVPVLQRYKMVQGV